MATDPFAFFEAASASINRALGAETVTLSRTGKLFTDRNEAPSSLLVKTTAISGASSIVLKAADGLLLSGTLLKDTRLAIAGHASPYLAATDAQAAEDGASITVTLASALSSGATAGVAVTLSAGPVYTWTNALVISTERRDRGGDIGADLYMVVDLPVRGAPTTPEEGDGLTRAYDGSVGRVGRVPPALAGSWRVEVGAM